MRDARHGQGVGVRYNSGRDDEQNDGQIHSLARRAMYAAPFATNEADTLPTEQPAGLLDTPANGPAKGAQP